MILLVSSDADLARKVDEIVYVSNALHLQQVMTAPLCRRHLQQPHLALVLAHLNDGGNPSAICQLMQSIASAKKSVPVIVIGESGLAEQGLGLLRRGAADYLERPLDLKRLAYLLDVLTVRARRQLADVVAESSPVEVCDSVGEFIYLRTSAMGQMMDQVRLVAQVDSSVLLQGETGTGKTCLARVIHELSSRRELPFLVFNCAAHAANLIESEMFGHVKGAFTGADRDRVGKFQAAGRGTLFLDEIDSLPLEIQTKLLRAVDDRVFEPVGSNHAVPLEARLIAASNRDLELAAANRQFRSDLLFRLNVVSFRLASLHERLDVLPVMVSRFVREFADRAGRNIPGVSSAAIALLRAYDWPGNIRELRNVLERAVALRPAGVIDCEDLPQSIQNGGWSAAFPGPDENQLTLARKKAAIEAAHITEALQRNNNNRRRAAAELGISRMTLYNKLHRYGLGSANV